MSLQQISLLKYLERACAEYPQRVAYQCENRSITCERVMRDAKKIGSALCNHAAPKSPVIIISEKSVLTPVLYHAVLYAGCFYVPVGSDMPKFRLQLIFDIVDAGVILTDGKNDELLQSLSFRGTVLRADELMNAEIDEDALAARRRQSLSEDPAYVIFTSGTSGTPKGIVTPHRAVIDCIDIYADEFGITRDEVIGNQSPLDYIAAVRDIYLPLCTGARTVMIPKKLFSMPVRLFEYVNETGVTTINWVAAALALCVDLKAFDSLRLPNVKKVLFAGSVLACRHLKVWQDNLPDAVFINHYGPTEVTRSCTYYVVPGKVDENDVLPIGVPFANTEIILLNDEGTDTVPDGEIGEICVRGSGLALGYYKDPERTRDFFIDNPLQKIFPDRIYKTGDLGRLMPDGSYAFHGRKDSQIKHMGHRIELGEIEFVSGSIEGLSGCACLYHQEKEQICFFYAGDTDNRAVARFMRERLPSHMIPRRFIKLENMPLGFNGKIDTSRLRKMMESDVK